METKNYCNRCPWRRENRISFPHPKSSLERELAHYPNTLRNSVPTVEILPLAYVEFRAHLHARRHIPEDVHSPEEPVFVFFAVNVMLGQISSLAGGHANEKFRQDVVTHTRAPPQRCRRIHLARTVRIADKVVTSYQKVASQARVAFAVVHGILCRLYPVWQ